MSRGILKLAIASALIAPTAPALAQTGGENENILEEVTVTARKRAESLQDVPFSIAAATGQQMRERGLVSIEDVSRTVASFSVQNLGPGQSQVAIRGDDGIGQDAAETVYVGRTLRHGSFGRGCQICICCLSLWSRALSDSSSSNTFGFITSARAIATRWRWPPDSCVGDRSS